MNQSKVKKPKSIIQPQRLQRPLKISPPLKWTEKYILRAKRQMPSLVLPRRIRSYKPHLKKVLRTYGSCCRDDRLITLATHRSTMGIYKGRRRRKLVPFSQKEILLTLAHEIAHLEYYHHGYEHEWYARAIFHTFGLKELCTFCGGRGKVPATYED